jgi:multidrug transporter EmrE-like cation transporter
MQPIVPVMVALISAVIGVERLTVPKAAGIATAVAGAVVMLDVTHIDLASACTDGILILLLQCLSYAFFIITLARVLAKDPRPFTVFAWASTFGALALSITAAFHMAGSDLQHAPFSVWLGLVYCSLVVSVGAHSSISWAVQHVSAAVPSSYACLQPLCTTAAAALVYGDKLGWHDAAGMALILPGMVLAVWAKRRDDAQQAPQATNGEAEHVDFRPVFLWCVQSLKQWEDGDSLLLDAKAHSIVVRGEEFGHGRQHSIAAEGLTARRSEGSADSGEGARVLPSGRRVAGTPLHWHSRRASHHDPG